MALARAHPLDEQLVERGNPRPARLYLEDGTQCLHLGPTKDPTMCFIEAATNRGRELAGQRQAASHPPRDDTLSIRRASDPRAHVTHAHELQRLSGEREAVARTQTRDERLLDRSETLAAQILHGDLGIAHDGTDG